MASCYDSMHYLQHTISHIMLHWSKRPASQLLLAADKYMDRHSGKYTLCIKYDSALQLQTLHVMHKCDQLLLRSAATTSRNAQV